MLDWDIHQMDVKMAFLYGDLGEEVYMEQLEGGKEPGKEDWVFWLDKTLYGLMQAMQGWNQHLHQCWPKKGDEDLCVSMGKYGRTPGLGTSFVGKLVVELWVPRSSTEKRE